MYTVKYKARKRNASGTFGVTEVTVNAGTALEAWDKAFDELHNRGMETLHPVGIWRVDENKLVDVTAEAVAARLNATQH